jgi:hypothetical protein
VRDNLPFLEGSGWVPSSIASQYLSVPSSSWLLGLDQSCAAELTASMALTNSVVSESPPGAARVLAGGLGEDSMGASSSSSSIKVVTFASGALATFFSPVVVPAFLAGAGTQLEEVVDVEDVVEDDLTAAMLASSEAFALSFLCDLASCLNGIVGGGGIETLSPFAGWSTKGALAATISLWALAALLADAMMALAASAAGT